MKTMPWIRFLCVCFAFGVMAAEIPVSDHVVRSAAPRHQYDAAAASNGDEYLVVWSDDRADVRQTYAARVSRDGTVLDPNGFRVATSELDGFRVASQEHRAFLHVIWGGKAWFVFSHPCGSIKLVRVGADGTVLDARPRAYSYGAICSALSLASDGNHVVVAYVTGSQPSRTYAFFLDSDARPFASVQLPAAETEVLPPVMTANGSSFVAVWKDRAVRFDRNGLLGTARDVSFLGSVNGAMSIGSDGRDMLVVRGNRAFRLSADLVAEPLGALPFSNPKSITWTGSEYVVAGVEYTFRNNTQHAGNIKILRVDRDGRLAGEQEVRTDGVQVHPARGPAVASNGENVLVAWHDPTEAERTSSPPEADTFLSVVSLPGLTPAPRKLLSVTAGLQLRPATAASGNQLLTVWHEADGIYARRHWRSGRTDGPPIRLTTDATSMDVVFNGSDFIVATAEGAEVVTRRLPATGELRVLGERRFAGVGPVALAHSDGVTLLAWLHQGVRAARLAADGSPIGGSLEIAPHALAREAHRVAISPNGAGAFLIVWGGSTRESGMLRAARVTSALTLLDGAPIEIVRPVASNDPSADPKDARYDAAHSLKADHPSVTWNGQEWLVVWNRGFRAEQGAREEIRGRRIAPHGALLDGSASDPGILIARDGFAPTVAWTGSRYVLAWYAGVPTYSTGRNERSLQRIRTAFFDSLGGPLSNERTLGESTAEDPISIAVANDFTVLAYSRLGDDRQYGGVARAFLDMPTAVPAPLPRRRAARQ